MDYADILKNIQAMAVMLPDRNEFFDRVVRLLRQRVPHFNWVGIYWVKPDRQKLALGSWDGPEPTEHTEIPVTQGICGAAVREARTIIVDDVRRDPRYLSCFVRTRSEIVVPIFKDGKVIGEIDIDSDTLCAFSEADRVFLESVAEILASRA
ncbi:MAG: GAF domain-containing protein [bacterium JZ-2024 1]